MRRKVSVIGEARAAGVAALLIAQRDLANLVLLDAEVGLADDLDAAAALEGYEPRVTDGGWPDVAGSDVVVVAGVGPRTASELAERCPGAVIVVATPEPSADVAALLEGTRLPRGRVLGVHAGEEGHGPITHGAATANVVDAVLRDRHKVISAYVLCRPDDGEAPGDEVRRAQVRVGGRGIEELVD